MKSNATAACRHPKVVMIFDHEEDTLGAASIVSDFIDEYRTIQYSQQTKKLISDFKPLVILFALDNVQSSIELYSELVQERRMEHAHYSVLMCKNRESGMGVRVCLKGLFDDYFVYQPLYEKFRLKMIVHNGLKLTQNDAATEEFEEVQFEQIDEELASLIDEGAKCKQALIAKIERSKEDLFSVSETITQEESAPAYTPKQIMEEISDKHVTPLLDSLQANIQSELDKMIGQMLKMQEMKKGDMPAKQLRDKQQSGKVASFKKHLAKVTKEKNKGLLNTQTKQQCSSPGKKILVVEDNGMYREMLVKVLSKEKFDVDEAVDGLKALQKIKKTNYDCILMDLFMPHLDGLNTTKQIRKVSGGKDIPVIALTGNKKKEIVKKWAAVGLNSYIVKPSNREEILTAVSKAFG